MKTHAGTGPQLGAHYGFTAIPGCPQELAVHTAQTHVGRSEIFLLLLMLEEGADACEEAVAHLVCSFGQRT